MTEEELFEAMVEAVAVQQGNRIRAGLEGTGLDWLIIVVDLPSGAASLATSLPPDVIEPFLRCNADAHREAKASGRYHPSESRLLLKQCEQAAQLVAATLAKKDQNEGC